MLIIFYLIALIFHSIIATGWDNPDGPYFEELFLEGRHASTSDSDALVHGFNARDLNVLTLFLPNSLRKS